MELLLLVGGVVATVFILRHAFKKYEATKNNVETEGNPVDFVKNEVKNVLDVNNDGKVNLEDAVVAAEKVKKVTKKVANKTKKAVTKAKKPKLNVLK